MRCNGGRVQYGDVRRTFGLTDSEFDLRERGPIHEFTLCHAADVETPARLFRILYSEVPT
jgi:hypothetical protein